MTQNPRKAAPYAALAVFFACLTASAPSQADDMNRTVTVSASATAQAAPDAASITSGVVSDAETARAALDANSKSMSNLIDGLKASGVDEKDLQTSSFSIQPRYENVKQDEPPQLVGYRVQNSVNVVVRDLAKLGETMDLMVSLGANQVHDMNFIVTNAETLRDEARREAIANALRRAELYAAAAGAEVGDVVRISEEGEAFEGGPRPMFRGASMTASVPVATGQETLEARVTVTWELE